MRRMRAQSWKGAQAVYGGAVWAAEAAGSAGVAGSGVVRWQLTHQPIERSENWRTRCIVSTGPWHVWQTTPAATCERWSKKAKSGRLWTRVHSIGVGVAPGIGLPAS